MSASSDRASKPDGSAYKAHMEALAGRNAEARKQGRARRQEREDERAAADRATERRQDAGLRGSGARQGRAELR